MARTDYRCQSKRQEESSFLALDRFRPEGLLPFPCLLSVSPYTYIIRRGWQEASPDLDFLPSFRRNSLQRMEKKLSCESAS
jgi:hypothetical protein